MQMRVASLLVALCGPALADGGHAPVDADDIEWCIHLATIAGELAGEREAGKPDSAVRALTPDYLAEEDQALVLDIVLGDPPPARADANGEVFAACLMVEPPHGEFEEELPAQSPPEAGVQ